MTWAGLRPNDPFEAQGQVEHLPVLVHQAVVADDDQVVSRRFRFDEPQLVALGASGVRGAELRLAGALPELERSGLDPLGFSLQFDGFEISLVGQTPQSVPPAGAGSSRK
jgi:hypothetical protein